MSKSAPWLLSLVVIVALVPVPAGGQSQATTGVIEGVVQTEQGDPVPGVTVTVTNTATNFEKTLTSDGSGRFRALLLPLGPYRLTASLEGFATLVRDGIQVGLGQDVYLLLRMQLEEVGEEIVVTSEAPLIESTRTEGQVRIDDRAIEGLPNNGRNFLEFTQLTPGVTIVQGPDGEELSISGQKGINNNVSVDGADFNNPFFGEQRGGQRPPFTFNIDAVKEVLVVTDGAPAEFGRSSGGFVNVVTKSGTNTMSGSFHAFYKDDSLSSDPQNRDGSTVDRTFDQTQVGFTLGGPIRRDKVFWFLAYDAQTAEETKQTAANRIDRRLVDYLTSIGIPDEDGPIDRTDDADVALAKIDWQESARNLVTVRGSYTFSEQENGTFDVDEWARSANGIEQDDSHAITTSVISTLSANLLNEFRAQYAQEDRPRPYPGPNLPGQSRPMPDTAIVETGNRFGMPFFLPIDYNDDRIQFNNNLSILAGAHAIKAGVEYNEVSSSQTFIGFANGRFIFNTVDGFINYAQNPLYRECSDGSTTQTGSCPDGTIAVGPVELFLQFAGVGRTAEEAGTQTLRQKEPALFIQDQWQPSANLTVDFGLRWERMEQPDPITAPGDVFFSDFIGQTVNTAAGPQTFPSDGTIPTDDQIQPRFAFAWSPRADQVVRGSAGMYMARAPALTWASVRSTNGSVGQTLFRNTILSPSGLGILGPVPAWDELIAAGDIGIPFFPDVFVADSDYELPKTLAYSLSWEDEVAPNYALLVKLNYAKTDHITRWVNRNDPLLGSPWSSGLAPGGVNGINALNTVESTAKSRYRAITLGINKRYANNFQFQFYYTYSEDESDDDNERDPFTIRYAKITDLDAEFNYSDRHQKNRFNGWLLWTAPGGFDVNARISFREAQPLDITPAGLPVGGFPPVDRCIPAPPIGVTTCDPAATVFRRNQGEKDNEFFTVDLRVAKNFKVGDFTIQPVVDIFNLTDEDNFLVPQVTSLAFNFDGTVRSGAGQPREFQLGIRILK